MNKYIAIAVTIALMTGAGAFILRRATSKENVQHITIERGGNAVINTEVKEEARTNWTAGIYMEKNTKGKGIVFGVKINRSI